MLRCVGEMSKFLIALILLAATPVSAQEYATINVNRVCAAIVNIPYASDNFSDEEWEKFKWCVKYLKSFDGVK